MLWHRGFGLLAGGWLLLLAVTGSAIVFYQELDHALNPDLLEIEPGVSTIPVASGVARAEAFRAGWTATAVDLPNGPRDPLVVDLAPPAAAGEDAAPLQVYVDPYDGRVLGARTFGALRLDRRHLASLIYRIHMDLHLGRTMTFLLGLVALLWVIDHPAAAVLSFPRRQRWRESFGVRTGARGLVFHYALHRAGGLWFLLVTLTLAVSGVYFDWYPWFRAAVEVVSPVTPLPSEAAPRAVAEPRLALDDAIARARRAAGGARVDAVSWYPEQGTYWLRLFDPRDLDPYGGRWMTLDLASGAVLEDRHPAAGTLGDRILAWQYPLHSGRRFGWPGRIAVFVAGLATAGLVVTGYLVWWRRRRFRRGARPTLRRPRRLKAGP